MGVVPPPFWTDCPSIEDDHVTRPEGGALLDGGAHRRGHCPQMDGDVGRLGQ